jgi:hypothetical protein
MVARGSRSVSELLPARFEDLDLDHVRGILDQARAEGETLFLELKETLAPNALAKTCAAFANTFGGLLIVGAADDTAEAVGIEPIGEAQLRVKDILRGHVLPLPPFRARWIALDGGDGRGLLLVLVDESSTTPHILTRSGAIYVRSPGSSDPVPIADQGHHLLGSRLAGRPPTPLVGGPLNLGRPSDIPYRPCEGRR